MNAMISRRPTHLLPGQRATQAEANETKQQSEVFEISKNPDLYRDPADEGQFSKQR